VNFAEANKERSPFPVFTPSLFLKRVGFFVLLQLLEVEDELTEPISVSSVCSWQVMAILFCDLVV
jgi:hypothetical protein